ncbi:MAG: homoprotocatechuate degradation operon regulator HpaR [Pikeienuella sp.]
MSKLRGFRQSLPISLLRARESTMRLFKPYVDSENLSLPQWRVIRALAEGGAHDATDLAERCAVLPPSMSRMLPALQSRGLISRGPSPEDARRQVITLTDEGMAMFKRVAPNSENIYRQLEATFGTDRLNRLLDELDELNRVADDLSAMTTPPALNSAESGENKA